MIEVGQFIKGHLGEGCTMDIFDEKCMWVEGKTLKRLKEVAKLVEDEYDGFTCSVGKVGDAKILRVYAK